MPVTLTIEELKASQGEQPVIRLASGLGHAGFRILDMIVDIEEPQKSYYQTHDINDDIKKWPTLQMAISYYNEL